MDTPKYLDFCFKLALRVRPDEREFWGSAGLRNVLYGIACLSLAACGDPIADIQRLSEQDIPEQSASVDVVAAPVPEGASLFERLLGETAQPSGPAPASSEAPLDTAEITANTPATDQSDPAVEVAVAAAVAAPAPAPEPKRTGLMALLTRAAPPKQDVVPAPDDTAAVQVAMVNPEAAPTSQSEVANTPSVPQEPDAAAGTKHKSIFGIQAAKPKPAAVSEIPPGTVLPYGKLARVCGLPKRDLGKKVLQYPEKRPQHRIYDTNPGSTAPRTFFVTGFGDGCARQFTASLAMFGSASMHEQLRYGLPADVQPYSDTDKAYEKLKSRVCKVPRKKPCGAKVNRMEKNTVFLSIYERFGSNARWKNLLLHDGEVVAQDIKGG